MAGEHVEYYKDGSVKGKGQIADGKPDGYWEWFRKNGTKMRSGHFHQPSLAASSSRFHMSMDQL